MRMDLEGLHGMTMHHLFAQFTLRSIAITSPEDLSFLASTTVDVSGTVPGFSLEIEPGSVTFPGGSRSGLISVTVVHGDKVPMVPNFGQQPRFIVTIQPAGVRFEPPAQLCLPVWVLRDIDEARVSALASALAQAGKSLMPEDPWN